MIALFSSSHSKQKLCQSQFQQGGTEKQTAQENARNFLAWPGLLA